MSKAVVMQWTVATIEKLVKFHRGLSKEAFWTEERLILYVALYKPNVDLFFFSEHDGHFFLLDSPHYGRVEEKKRVCSLHEPRVIGERFQELMGTMR